MINGMKRKPIIIAIIIILATLLLLFALGMVRPSVSIVSSDLPLGFSIIKKRYFSPNYRFTGNAANADLVIVMPDSQVPESSGRVVLFGREAEEGETPDLILIPDMNAIWECALSDRVEGILYNSAERIPSSIASHLLSIDDNAIEASYSGRVSVANEEELQANIENADVILFISPTSSTRILRDTQGKESIVDFLHYTALESTAVTGYVGIDWDSTIRGLLDGGDTLDYALFPAEN